jgi:hypothetical protein
MSVRRSIVLTIVLLLLLSTVALAASPWIAVVDPNPQKVWEKQTETMVKNVDPSTVWESGKEYMIVWDSAGLTGNVKVELMKDGKVVATLSPAAGIPVGEKGKGFLKTIVYATAGAGKYQVGVSSLAVSDISSVSEPVQIDIVKK